MKLKKKLLAPILYILCSSLVDGTEDKKTDIAGDVTQGALRVVQQDGQVVECPLKHTDVTVDIVGFIARVRVVQTFHNPFDKPIQATYVFPLPHESAVDEMTMVLPNTRIVGIIKRKAEARQMYNDAIQAGKTASLLEQERPNIFIQTVGNIQPGTEIRIEIGYIDVLVYDQGEYEFHFPMVVGPRYNPPNFKDGIGAVLSGSEGTSGLKTEVSYLKPGQRTGHNISLSVKLDSGVPVRDLKVIQHKSEIKKTGKSTAMVKLSVDDAIPNKDFILRYKVVGEKTEMALLTHARDSKGYFLLMIQPQEDEKLQEKPPREVVFLIDVSGSMRGRPTEQAMKVMVEMLSMMRAKDTLQVITFAGMASPLFIKPVPVTKENIEKALDYIRMQGGNGGTNMLEGIRSAIRQPIDPERVRMVVMLTDGYIGNESEIVEEIGIHCGDQIQFWCIGVGSSVNRFLVDGVGKHGGGMGKVLAVDESPTEMCKDLMERIQHAQLTHVEVNYGDLSVDDIHPEKVPNLYAGRPIILFGQYHPDAGGGTYPIEITGDVEGEPTSWKLDVPFPDSSEDNECLAKVWARKKIESLMQKAYYRSESSLEGEVTEIALAYSLTSNYTSFVAVDERDCGKDTDIIKPPLDVNVAVPMPYGVSHEGTFTNIEAGGFGQVGFMGVGGGGMAGRFGNRLGGRRNAALRGGGSKRSEAAVDAALSWLARHQEEDGHWDNVKYGGTSEKHDTAQTGLAMLAFHGGGHTEQAGIFRKNVAKAVQWIEKTQQENGAYGDGWGYTHAICGLAMAEASGMTNVNSTKESAQKAVDYSVNIHQIGEGANKSGWRYTPKAPTGDISCSGWFIMQIKSAKVAGLKVSFESFQGAVSFLDSVEVKTDESDPTNRHRYMYMATPDSSVQMQPTAMCTAIGIMSRQFLGYPRIELEGGVKYMLENGGVPKWGNNGDSVDFYYWYYGTLVTFQMGGDYFKQWNEAIRDILCDKQIKGDDNDGSWEPVGRYAGEGRVFSTAMGALCLEVYYRYSSLYR